MFSQLATLASGRGAAGLLSALWLITAARTLSPSAFGDLALILAVGSMGGVLSDLGQQTSLAHETAQLGYLDKRLIGAVLRRRLLLSIAAIAFTSALYLSAATNGSFLIPLIYALSILGTAIYSTQIAALTAIGRAQVDGANEVISRMGVLVVGWWWLHNGGGLTGAVAVYALADVVSAVVITLVTRKTLVDSDRSVNLTNVSLRKTVHLAFAMTAAIVYARVDIWLLGQLKGSVTAGHYAAADRILDAVLLIPAALGSLAIAQTSPLPPSQRWDRTKLLAGLAVLLAALPAAVVAPFAGPIMGWLFGESFRPTAFVLVVLLMSAPFGAVAAACSPVSAVTTRWLFTIVFGAGLLVNIVLNLILIPTFDATGAAEANLASELLLAVLLLASIRHQRYGRERKMTPQVDGD